MKKIIILICLALGMVAVSITTVYAQNVPSTPGQKLPSFEEVSKQIDEAKKNVAILADVEVRNTQIVYNEKNKFKVAFTITNNLGIQTGVKYAIQLMKKENNNSAVYDRKVFDEKLTLGEKETVPKVVDYEAPYFASGNFELWVTSTQENGLPLGQSKVADVKLTGEGSSIQLKDCYLTIDGSDGVKYKLQQGIDITKDENLSITCQVKSNFTDQVSVVPQFETRYRTGLGKVVSEKKSDSLILNNEEREITIPIPRENLAQAYDIALVLKNEQDQAVSYPTYFHYVAQGLSGTIQNLRLDKDSYAAGETATATFAFSGSADDFIGARTTGGTRYGKAIIELAMTDALGNSCADKIQRESPSKPMDQIEMKIPLKTDCSNGPKVSIILKDPNGNVLDNFSALIGKIKPTQQETKPSGSLANLSSNVRIFVVIVTILAIILIIAYRSKKRKTSGINFLIFFPLLSIGIMYGSQAKAVTFYTANTPTGYSVFQAQLDRSQYRINDTVTAYGTDYACTCGNAHTLWMVGYVNNQQDYVVKPYWGYGSSGSKQFSGPPAPGSYTAWFSGHDDALASTYGIGDAWGSIGYNVLPPPPPAVDHIDANPKTIDSGQQTIVYWNSGNAVACYLWGGPWNATYINPNISGSAWTGALYSNTVFTIGCHNNIDWAWSSVTVNIARPTVSISASPNPVAYGGTTVLNVNSTGNPTWCTISGGQYSNTPCGGSGQINPAALTTATTYTYTCGNAGGTSIPASVQVNVNTAPCTPTFSCQTISDGNCTGKPCGSHVTKHYICQRTCGGATTTVSKSECTSRAIACPANENLTCPACSDDKWKEVAP